MGVYNHMMRPSMGHHMQVELRESMRRYQGDKAQLKQQIAKLRFDKKDLHTEPLPPTPPPPVKRWGDKGSRFNKAPELAAEKARLAKLEQAQQDLDQALAGSTNPVLPPIPGHKDTTDGGQANADPAPAATEDQGQNKTTGAPNTDTAKISPKSPVTKKVVTKKFGKKLKKKGKKGAGRLHLLRLPIIHSASLRERTMWDSGQNHLHPKMKATVLEKNKVEEDCRNFTQHSHVIPDHFDSKRSEIQRPSCMRQPREATVVKFSFGRAARTEAAGGQSGRAEAQTSNSLVQDHFPHNVPRLHELEDSGSEVSDTEEEEAATLGTADSRFKLPRLPVVRAFDSGVAPAPHSLQQNGSNVPRLPRGITPSAISTATGRSGATGATYMSQETLEWKGEYMTSDNQEHKGRMLVDILHSVRQRMHDNEEDLRLSGNDPRPRDKLSKEGRSDIMLVHRNVTPSSGATTARSTEPHRLMKLPQQQKKGGSLSQSQNSKLHRYLHKLSSQRRHAPAPFQLAGMTIREITQSSLGHHSTVHTAHTAQTAN